MKRLKYLLVIAFIPLLISCDSTTVRGDWKSDTFDDGHFVKMHFDNDRFVSYNMVTDLIYSERTDGTWNMHGDTITLYVQGRGITDIIVQQLSMDNMTIQYGHGKKILTMSRMYNDPNNKTSEVVGLKVDDVLDKIKWKFSAVGYFLPYIIGIIIVIGLGYLGYLIVELILELIERLFKK